MKQALAWEHAETAILTHPANHQVVDNTVLDCRYGLRVPFPTGHLLGPFEPANGLYVSCNTFWRTVPLGQSADVALDQDVEVAFAHRDQQTNAPQPGTNGTPYDGMKNWFRNTGSAGNAGANVGWNLYNDHNNPAVVYKTFAALSPGVPASNTSNITTVGSVVVTAGSNQGVMPEFNESHNCSQEDGYINGNGILRRQGTPSGVTAPGTGNYLTVWPNPADEQLIVSLALPATLTSGELIIRDGIQGQIIRRIALRAGQTEASLDVRQLPAGLYQCNLLLEGRSVKAVRLQITH